MASDFARRLQLQGGVAAAGTGAASKACEEDKGDKSRRRRKSAPAAAGNIDVAESTKPGLKQKYVVDMSVITRRRPGEGNDNIR